MNPDILLSVIAGVLSLLGAGAVSELFPQLARRLLKQAGPKETYSQKLVRLTESLTKSSSEVDNVLAELTQVARDREKAVQKLEMELRELETREKQLQRIHDLENVPIPVAEHFAKLTAASERRSALRDYSLFGAGVVVSTVIAIALKLVGAG